MQFFFTLLSFVALASAYQVTSPGGAAGWTIAGPNVVTWQRVSTDALNFTIVLSNQAQTPNYQQVLAALVDGTLGRFTVSPPSTGFPTGTGFRVNLVQDSQNLNTIYAQSEQFSITQPTTTVTSSRTTTTPFTSTSNTLTNTDTDLNPTGSLTNTTAPSNGADRMATAGSAGLIFGVLAAMVL
ncbi:hypothetical protein BJY52DRAFT_1220048 [Lactarius psammicola]|nr:hypothetical protein BJY52DRAFT_1220048 [Lactarius psammicola]